MKLKFIAVGLFFAFAISGCGSDGPEEPGGCQNSYYDIQAMQLLTFNSSEGRGSYLAGDSYEDDAAIPYQNLVFALRAETQYVKLQRRFFDFSLISKAYATSCVPPQANENIVNIDITSGADFSDDLPAGTSLNAVFDMVFMELSQAAYYGYKDGEQDFFSIEEFLNTDNKQASKVMQLALNTEPSYKHDHIFYITIELDSGEQFILESRELSFE